WLRLRRVPMFVYCPAENRYPGFAESLLGCVRRLGAPPGARRPGRSAQVTIDLLPDRVCLSPLRARTCESIDAGLLDSSATSTHHTELHRPADCPVAKIAEGVGLQPPAQPDAADTRRRFTRVAAAAAILLESGDGRLLLTRRPAGMSAFPEVWVPPGGHLDLGETAAQAAARELAEEVGLTLPAGGAGPPIRLLTAWESVFPASLDIGWPARHHLVLYFHARLSESSASLTSAAKPEPREVDRLVWIDRRLARRIGGTLLLEEGDGLADDGDRQNSREETPDEETVPSWSLDRSEVPVQVSQLLSCRPDAKNRQQQQPESDWVRVGLAGCSNLTAAVVTNPVDVVKIRLQIQGEAANRTSSARYAGFIRGLATVVRNEGLRGLYKGVVPSMMRDGGYGAIRVGLYEPVKRLFGETDPANFSLWKKICSGAVTGVLGSAVATPTDLVKVRMQAFESGARYRGTWHAFVSIYAEGGVPALYKGIGPTVARAAVVTATQVPSYDHFKHTMLSRGLLKEGLPLHFLASMFAGLMCAITTSPLDVVKTRVMNQDTVGLRGAAYSNAFSCAAAAIRTEGLTGLYKGFVPNWMRIGPHTVITFMIFEQLRKLVGIRPI
ncbi:hypothetical protein BOX15_Mlig010689g2, partial [Macrostomum lignano]